MEVVLPVRGRLAARLVKSQAGAGRQLRSRCPHFGQAVLPFFTSSPHTGQPRFLGRVINQIKEKKTKPKKPISKNTAIPMPVPALLASSHVFTLSAAWWAHSVVVL